jgi:hypothetical protein
VGEPTNENVKKQLQVEEAIMDYTLLEVEFTECELTITELWYHRLPLTPNVKGDTVLKIRWS